MRWASVRWVSVRWASVRWESLGWASMVKMGKRRRVWVGEHEVGEHERGAWANVVECEVGEVGERERGARRACVSVGERV